MHDAADAPALAWDLAFDFALDLTLALVATVFSAISFLLCPFLLLFALFHCL